MKIKATTKAYVRDILTRTIFRQQETLDKFLFKTNWSEQVHSQQLQRDQDFRRQGAVREPQADPGLHPGEEHHGDVLLQPAGHRSGGRQALSQADSRHHHVRGQQQLQHWDHGNVKRGGTYEEKFNNSISSISFPAERTVLAPGASDPDRSPGGCHPQSPLHRRLQSRDLGRP